MKKAEVVEALLDKLKGYPAGFPHRQWCGKCERGWFTQMPIMAWSTPRICPECRMGHAVFVRGWWTR